MAKKREGQQQAAYEAGMRGTIPGQNWIEALGRGLLGELYGSDMGTPVGQKLREELGSVGYDNVLRELYPEDYAMGRAMGPMSDVVDFAPLSAMGMTPRMAYRGEVLPPVRPMAAPRGASGPIMEGRATGPGLGAPAPRALEDMSVRRGPYREVPIAPQTSGFERGAVAAAQRGRQGFGYGYEAPGYFEEGGQGFQPHINDYVDVNVVRNPQEYYNQSLQDHLAAQMRMGNRGVMRHEMYGPTGDRPPFGVGGEGKGYFGEMPNPGVQRRPLPSTGPIAEMPRPGVRYDGRTEMGQGAGAPRLRYEPVGGDMVPGGGVRAPVSPTGYGIGGGGGNLPAMAGGGGRGLVPREIQGEFYEAPGIGYAGTRGIGGGVAGGGAGVPRGAFGPAIMAAGGMAAVPGLMYASLRPQLPSNNPLQPQGPSAFQMPMTDEEAAREGGRRMDVMNGLPAAPQRVAPQRVAQKAVQRAAGKKVVAGEMPVKEIPASPEWNPNFNYLVTQAIDRMLGQREAERGRAYQQQVEDYRRQYGPIYY